MAYKGAGNQTLAVHVTSTAEFFKNYSRGERRMLCDI